MCYISEFGIMSLDALFQDKRDEFIKNAKNAFAKACDIENEAIIFEKNEVWNTALKKYYEATNFFRKACTYLESINVINESIANTKTKEHEEDNSNSAQREQLIEYYSHAAKAYSKTAQVFSKLDNKYEQANMLGLAAEAYFKCIFFSDDKDLEIERKTGQVYSYGDTLFGKVIGLYRNSANLFNDIAIEQEELGKKRLAYVSYGYMGDAYMSIAKVQEEDTYWITSTTSDQAESYFCAGEAYTKSGKLNREIGVSSVVVHARIEWNYAFRTIVDLFKENGYYTANDLKRAIVAYTKSSEAYQKVGNDYQEKYCTSKIEEIKQILEPKIIKPEFKTKTGYPWADATISDLFNKIGPNILPEDLNNYQLVAAQIMNYMGQNLQENFFADNTFTEKEFQTDFLKHFRRDPTFGESTLKEVYIGGGKADILAREVPIELKVEKELTDTEKVIEKHKGQASQYASGYGKQIGFLCVLDLTKKTKAPPYPANDVQINVVSVHGTKEGEVPIFPSKVVTFIIRGNLEKPSAIKKYAAIKVVKKI